MTNTFITIADGQQLQLAQFGPAPTTTTVASSSPVQLVYVLDSDIWLLSLVTNVTLRVTNDGAVGSTFDWAASATAARAPHAYGSRIGGMASAGFGSEILNGVCDWAYEEEVFSQSSAIWWAPDATSFLFLKFKQVPETNIHIKPHTLDSAVNDGIESKWDRNTSSDRSRCLLMSFDVM